MTEAVIKRLQAGALERLVDLSCDHLLDQPLVALVDVDWVAERITHGIGTWSQSEQTEIWIRARVTELREKAPQGRLSDHIPSEVSAPLTELVQRPFVPDRVIIGRLLSHKAVESLVSELLVGTLQSFAQKLKPNVPGSSRLRSLKRVGDGVLGGIGSVLEGQAESRVRDFVDTVMAQVMNQIADYICNPSNAEAFGRFRGHLLCQLLETPISDMDRELDKLDPDDLVTTATAIARALSAREGLQDEIRQLILTMVDEAGSTTLRAHLTEAGVADEWHTQVRSKLTQSAQGFIETDGFKSWLTEVLNAD